MTAEVWEWVNARLEGEHRLREVLTRAFVEELMAVEVEARCRAATGERVNRRNGYRAGVFTMPSGSVPVRIPKLRYGGYAPQWLADGPNGAEDVLVAALFRGYVEGMSSDLVARLVDAVGVTELSTRQQEAIAAAMNTRIVAELARPLLDVDGDDVTIEIQHSGPHDEAVSVASISTNGAVELLGLVVGPDGDAADQELRRDLAARGLRGEVPRTNGAPVPPRSRLPVTIVVRDHRRIDDFVDEPVPRPRRRIPLLITAVAGLVLIVAVIIGSSAVGRFDSDPAPAPVPAPTDAPVPAAPAAPPPLTTAAATSAPVAAVVAPTTVPPNCIDPNERVPWMDQVQCEAVRGSPTG